MLLLVKATVAARKGPIGLHCALEREGHLTARAYNYELKVFRSIESSAERTIALKSVPWCEVASEVLLVLLNACEGHVCGSVCCQAVNSADV